FVSCTGNFGIPAILGIPASIFTLPTLIFTKFSAFISPTTEMMAMIAESTATSPKVRLVKAENLVKINVGSVKIEAG
ncbi:hypothetical protein AB9F46_36385, partial [Rhizobium leguminosarum]